MLKNLISGPVSAHLAHIWTPEVFSWDLPPLVVRKNSKLLSYVVFHKTYEPNLTKWGKT